MKKIVTIGENQVALESNAATGLRYKQVFQADLLKDLGKLDRKEDIEQLDAINYIAQLTYIMNMQSQGQVKAANEHNYIEWIEQFEEQDFQNEDTIMEILGVWNRNLAATSEQKNGQSPQQER